MNDYIANRHLMIVVMKWMIVNIRKKEYKTPYNKKTKLLLTERFYSLAILMSLLFHIRQHIVLASSY